MKLHYTIILLLIVVVVPYTMGIKEGSKSKKKGCTTEICWSPCFKKYVEENFPGVVVEFECADFEVPLDYDKPRRDMIQLSLVRRRATDTNNRIGSLLVNPGGPGGSGVDFALIVGALGGEVLGTVLDRYDVVGFDPRGIARSTPLRCFKTEDEALATVPESPFPFTGDEISEFEEFSMNLNDQCIMLGNEVLGHTSTANVARDMDKIRKALGEKKLNYYGLSYGTALGMTYANIYPNNVGAFVIDGNLDPIAWANLDCQVTSTNALRSDQGSQDTLNEFILQCNEAQSGNCPLAPNAGERLDAVLERLKTDPITLPVNGSQYELNYANMIPITLSFLYSPLDFLSLAELFVLLEAPNPDPEAIIQVVGLMPALMRFLRTGYDNSLEGFYSVLCSDSCNPTDYHAIFEAGKNATASYGYFGEFWNWSGGPCASWTTPDADKYTGPFNAVTSTPVLVVGNLYDPATRYQNAVLNNELLQNSILLTVDTPGHTSLDYNECADAHVSEYLANPVAYAKSRGDSVCTKERNFFDFLATPTDTSKRLGEFHKKIMEQAPVLLPF